MAKSAKVIVELAGAVETFIARPQKSEPEEPSGSRAFLTPDGSRYAVTIKIYKIGSHYENA